jgi:hypothetical protein
MPHYKTVIVQPGGHLAHSAKPPLKTVDNVPYRLPLQNGQLVDVDGEKCVVKSIPDTTEYGQPIGYKEHNRERAEKIVYVERVEKQDDT